MILAMAITDPTAIPETTDAIEEYLTAADAAWGSGDQDGAAVLYWSATSSSIGFDEKRFAEAYYRLGLHAEAQGDHTRAASCFNWASQQGHADATQKYAEYQATAQHTDVVADTPPQDAAEVERYATMAMHAFDGGDWERAYQLYDAIYQSPALMPANKAHAALRLGEICRQWGSHDQAYAFFEEAASMGVGDSRDKAAAYLAEYQKENTDNSGLSTSAGIDSAETAAPYVDGLATAYEQGNTTLTTSYATLVHESGGASAEQKATAAYYLGRLAYDRDDYDTARIYIREARDGAADPQRGWAAEMLQSYWQE